MVEHHVEEDALAISRSESFTVKGYTKLDVILVIRVFSSTFERLTLTMELSLLTHQMPTKKIHRFGHDNAAAAAGNCSIL